MRAAPWRPVAVSLQSTCMSIAKTFYSDLPHFWNQFVEAQPGSAGELMNCRLSQGCDLCSSAPPRLVRAAGSAAQSIAA